jgi:hypothetical protein
MASAQEELIKTGNNTLKQVAHQNGPWAVLFLALIIGVVWYIHSEKKECKEEVSSLKIELATANKELVSMQIKLSNCENDLKTAQITYSHYQTPNPKKR